MVRSPGPSDYWRLATLFRAIDEGIHRANKRAVSRAATVQKWAVLGREFTVAGGELSPSLKLKRSGYLNISTHYIHRSIKYL